MTCYREDSFYRSITPECRREEYTRCCEGHVMFNDCCVSEYICTLTMLGIYALYYWVRWKCCDLHVLMKGVLHVEYLLRCFQHIEYCDHYEIEGRLLQYLVEPLRHCHWIQTQHRNSALIIKKFCSSPDFNPIHSVLFWCGVRS